MWWGFYACESESLSLVWLFATPWSIQSMEFSRPEYWSGWLFPSPRDLPNPRIESKSPALHADVVEIAKKLELEVKPEDVTELL